MAQAPDYQAASPELWLRILNDLKKEFYYETSLSGQGTWIAVVDAICFTIGNYVSPYSSIEYMLANNWTVAPLPTYPPDVSGYQMEYRKIDDPNYVPSYVYYQNQNITEFLRLDIEAWVEVIDPMELYNAKETHQIIQVSEHISDTVKVSRLAKSQGMNDVAKHRRNCRIPLDKGLEMWPIYTFEIENATSRNNTNIEINITFPSHKFSTKEQFSFIDFMTSVGGAAGLFLGCSVLSAVEIFYYTTLHLYISKHKQN